MRATRTFAVLSGLSLGIPAAGQSVESELGFPSAAQGDLFGTAIAADGDWLVVGAPGVDALAENAGAAFAFERAPAGWVLAGDLDPVTARQAGDSFGQEVALFGDTLVVSAPLDDTQAIDAGVVYVFENRAGGWVLEQTLFAPDAQSDTQFGIALDLDGDRLIVGSGHAYVGTLEAALYVFEKRTDEFSFALRLSPQGAEPDDLFGRQIDLDGARLAVGAEKDDTAGFDAGAVYLFERSVDGIWSETAKLLGGAADDRFGGAVDMEGGRLAIGARGVDVFGALAGEVFLFELAGGTWVLTQELFASDPEPGARFGGSLALRGDSLLVGAWMDDAVAFNSGAAYLFERNGGPYREKAKLFPPDGAQTDWFGFPVLLSGADVFAGAGGRETNGAVRTGAVFPLDPAAFAQALCRCDAAPCGNVDADAGCASSTGGGARLAASGSASLARDDLSIHASSLPAGAVTLLFAGTIAVDLPFGDGRRCVGGAITRSLPVVAAAAGTTGLGSGFLGVPPAAGNALYLQALYRDPGGPCGTGFGLTWALEMTVAP